MTKRKVFSGQVNHVFQRTRNSGLVFYDVADYLVFFTVFCSQARKNGIQVLALCPMPDHVHQVVTARSGVQLSAFEKGYARLFAWEWNRSRGRKGALFHHRFDSAYKTGEKQVRTTLARNNNKPVERKLSRKAEEYRWTFLAYYGNTHPFSPELNLSRARSYVRSVIREIRECHDAGGYLRYRQLGRWERHLSAQEWLQVTDAIISLWNVIDFEAACAYYGDFEAMLQAFHEYTGSEDGLREERDNCSDTVYADCLRVLQAEGLVESPFSIPTLPDGRKETCFRLLLERTSARPGQIAKFLHLESGPYAKTARP